MHFSNLTASISTESMMSCHYDSWQEAMKSYCIGFKSGGRGRKGSEKYIHGLGQKGTVDIVTWVEVNSAPPLHTRQGSVPSLCDVLS